MTKTQTSLLFFLALAPMSGHGSGPALSIEEAISIAHKSLKERGLDDSHYVASATLASAAVLGSKYHWSVRWSESIPRGDRKKEIGVDIGMDGSVVHVVKAPTQAGGRKANQASVLDLKR